MSIEFAAAALFFTTILVLWSYVKEQQALEEHELYDDVKKKYKPYDKNDVKYTDGDNT